MDYKKLGFKSGLEIHQQLDTHKLFCNCPSILNDKKGDILIKRRLRGVAGETGDVDVAAEYEMLKNKEFVYQGWSGNTCLVEFDEEPPHDLNEDALKIVLQICKMFKCKTVHEIQIMRKTVVDGSNTSGFQRTVLVGYDGYLETSEGRVGIETVCLEEDAARRVSESKDKVVFNLDRLGIPLVEIVTSPDIKNPLHAKETAEKIGMVLRSTGKVKRGLGTVRQDVNVSIKKGRRVEIKGFQDLRNMPKVIENEVKRQLKGKVKPEVRRVEKDGSTSFMRPMPGSARMYPETDVRPVVVGRTLLGSVKIPELIDEKILRYEKYLSSDVARSLVKSGIEFEDYLGYELDKKLIANVLVEVPKDLKSRFKVDYKFGDGDYKFVLDALEKKEISKDAVGSVMLDISKGKYDLSKYKLVGDKEIEAFVKKVVKKNKDLSVGGVMGDVMKKYGGRVDGKKVAEIVKKVRK